MKRTMIFIIVMLTSFVSMSQITAEQRELMADLMQESMRTEISDCRITAMGTGNKMLMISWGEMDTYREVYAFLVGMDSSSDDVWDQLFDLMGFDYLCFKEIDKCYTKEEIKIILQ